MELKAVAAAEKSMFIKRCRSVAGESRNSRERAGVGGRGAVGVALQVF